MSQRLPYLRRTAATFAALFLLGSAATLAQDDNAAQDRDALIELVEQLKQENEQLNAALSQQDMMAAELKKAQDNAFSLRSQVEQFEQEKTEGQTRAAALAAELKQTQDNAFSLRAQIEQFEQEKTESDARAVEIVTQMAERDRTIAAQQDRLDELVKDQAEKQTAAVDMIKLLDQRDRAIAALERQLEEKDSSLTALNERVAALQQEAEQRDRRLASLGNRVGQLQQAQTRAIDERDQQQATAQRFRRMLDTARTNSRALQQEMQERLTALETSWSERFGEAKSQVSALGVKLRDARTERDGYRLNLKTAQTQIEEMSNKEYTVQLGDSLSKIAQSFYGDPQLWQTIYDANRQSLKNPSSLATGMRLVIPPR